MCGHCGCGASFLNVPAVNSSRPVDAGLLTVSIQTKILAVNDASAEKNRREFTASRNFAINFLSSPGAGKTTLLVETIKRITTLPISVIEGDQQTDLDAERIRATGAAAVQINTGRGCHLEAGSVSAAWRELQSQHDGLLFIENVGNLVCPALFDLGEALKVLVLSVTEGDDKPLKCPDIFRVADVLLINKIDLLPYVRFDVATCLANARRINPTLAAIHVSAERGDGLDDWIAWLLLRRQAWLATLKSTAAGVS